MHNSSYRAVQYSNFLSLVMLNLAVLHDVRNIVVQF